MRAAHRAPARYLNLEIARDLLLVADEVIE
jgi:hypothetical protein